MTFLLQMVQKCSNFSKILNTSKARSNKLNHSFGNIFEAQSALDQEMKQLQQRIITEARSDDLLEEEKYLESQISKREN